MTPALNDSRNSSTSDAMLMAHTLWLADRAEIARAPGKFDGLDRCVAAQAAGAVIHIRSLATAQSPSPREVQLAPVHCDNAVVAHTLAQHRREGVPDLAALALIEVARRPSRVDSGDEQRLGAEHVADTGDHRLV